MVHAASPCRGWTWWGPVVGLGSATALLVVHTIRLMRELDRLKSLRQAERQGRIRAETAIASLQTVNVTKSDSNRISESWKMFRIGTVHSVFAKRAGTPRQPGLVASAEATIEIVPELAQAIDSMGAFSHVWVLFVFHNNTNMAKRLKAKHPFDGLKLLVEPPKARGQKVGVLSCRTPHRPNPIGLSLCKVVRVDKCSIVVSGLDCLDGTPVIDIKPYLPIVEIVSDAIVPEWIYQGVEEDRQLSVVWDDCDKSHISESEERVIHEVLSRDIRSKHQMAVGAAGNGDWSGELVIGQNLVRYVMRKGEKVVRIANITRRD